MKDRFFKAYPELEEKIKDLKQEQFLLKVASRCILAPSPLKFLY